MEIQQVIDYLHSNIKHYKDSASIADNETSYNYYLASLEATQEVLDFIEGVK